MNINPILPLDYLVLLLAAVCVAGVFLAWHSAAKAPRRLRLLLAALRLLALSGLGLLALNPGRWQAQAVDPKAAWALLIDRSLSMSTPDANGTTRWTEACRLAGKAVATARKDSARIFTFAGELEAPVADPARLGNLTPDGPDTDIPDSIFAALTAFRAGDTRLTGLLVLSDGRQVAATEPRKATLLARSRGSPIFTLALGGPVTNKDLSIAMERRQYVTFTGQKLKLMARVTNAGLGAVSPTVQLIDPAGKVVAEQKVVFTNDGVMPVQLEIAPPEHGYFQYRARLPAWGGDVREANNESVAGVAVLASKIRIFMAEGTPFWDSKFLTQLLRQQTNMDVTSVYRLSANRYFRVDTDASRVADASEPIFPDDAALAKYDLMIFGRGAEYFLTPDRIQGLKNFVGRQGGCVIFARGKPYSGSFPELEPLEPASWGEIIGQPFRLRPTQEGEYAGLFGELLPDRGNPVWTQLSPLRQAHRCQRLKAFTRVLAEGVGAATDAGAAFSFPLVFSQRYGKGIVVVVNAEDLWQWFFFPALSTAGEIYQDFWIQLFTWAGTYSDFLPGRQYALRLGESLVYPDVPVRARIFRRAAAAETNAPSIRVLQGDRQVLELPATPAGDDGRWDAIFSLKQPGMYRVELAGLDPTSVEGVYATLGIRAPPSEIDDFSADPAFLAKLAEASGGRSIGEQDLESAIHELDPATRPMNLEKAAWAPLWNRAWVLSLLLGLLGLEWLIRRRNGLL